MVTIGITGPTGCGKTTLLQEIAARGGEIVDCDAFYYELLREFYENYNIILSHISVHKCYKNSLLFLCILYIFCLYFEIMPPKYFLKKATYHFEKP